MTSRRPSPRPRIRAHDAAFRLLCAVVTLCLLAGACSDDGSPTTDDERRPGDIAATGIVTDPEGVPVIRAILDLEALDGQPNPEIESLRLTDEDGRYLLAIAAGRWILTIAADGFELEKVDLDIPTSGVLETNVVLTPAS